MEQAALKRANMQCGRGWGGQGEGGLVKALLCGAVASRLEVCVYFFLLSS